MTIGVEDQYILSLTIGDNSDFLDADDLEEFTVVETAGNSLPEYILNFKAKDESIMKRLNEGNLIKAQFGRTKNDLKDINLSTSKIRSVKEGEEERFYETKGFAADINYITDHNTQITEEKSGVEVALEIANNNFTNVVSNIFKSSDKQRWIQYSISDKSFMNTCLLHSDLGSSFPLYAITADGTFILKDIVKDMVRTGLPYDWKFSRIALDPTDIVYDPDCSLSSKAGFINNWMGYGKEILGLNTETGVISSIIENPETILALSSSVDKNQSIGDRFAGTKIINENVHENYWAAHNHNLLSLANLSKVEIALSFFDEYRDVKPLDLVMFTDQATDFTLSAGEYQSGLYYVSAVIRTVQGRRMVTTVLLNREALNQVRNEA